MAIVKHSSEGRLDGRINSEAAARAAGDNANLSAISTAIQVHAAQTTHITAEERTAWNGKAENPAEIETIGDDYSLDDLKDKINALITALKG